MDRSIEAADAFAIESGGGVKLIYDINNALKGLVTPGRDTVSVLQSGPDAVSAFEQRYAMDMSETSDDTVFLWEAERDRANETALQALAPWFADCVISRSGFQCKVEVVPTLRFGVTGITTGTSTTYGVCSLPATVERPLGQSFAEMIRSGDTDTLHRSVPSMNLAAGLFCARVLATSGSRMFVARFPGHDHAHRMVVVPPAKCGEAFTPTFSLDRIATTADRRAALEEELARLARKANNVCNKRDHPRGVDDIVTALGIRPGSALARFARPAWDLFCQRVGMIHAQLPARSASSSSAVSMDVDDDLDALMHPLVGAHPEGTFAWVFTDMMLKKLVGTGIFNSANEFRQYLIDRFVAGGDVQSATRSERGVDTIAEMEDRILQAVAEFVRMYSERDIYDRISISDRARAHALDVAATVVEDVFFTMHELTHRNSDEIPPLFDADDTIEDILVAILLNPSMTFETPGGYIARHTSDPADELERESHAAREARKSIESSLRMMNIAEYALRQMGGYEPPPAQPRTIVPRQRAPRALRPASIPSGNIRYASGAVTEDGLKFASEMLRALEEREPVFKPGTPERARFRSELLRHDRDTDILVGNAIDPIAVTEFLREEFLHAKNPKKAADTVYAFFEDVANMLANDFVAPAPAYRALVKRRIGKKRGKHPAYKLVKKIDSPESLCEFLLVAPFTSKAVATPGGEKPSYVKVRRAVLKRLRAINAYKTSDPLPPNLQKALERESGAPKKKASSSGASSSSARPKSSAGASSSSSGRARVTRAEALDLIREHSAQFRAAEARNALVMDEYGFGDLFKRASHRTKSGMLTVEGAFHLAITFMDHLGGDDRPISQLKEHSATLRAEVVRRWGQEGVADVATALLSFVASILVDKETTMDEVIENFRRQAAHGLFVRCIMPAGPSKHFNTEKARRAYPIYAHFWQELGRPSIERAVHDIVHDPQTQYELPELAAAAFQISEEDAERRTNTILDGPDEEVKAFERRVEQGLVDMYKTVVHARAPAAPVRAPRASSSSAPRARKPKASSSSSSARPGREEILDLVHRHVPFPRGRVENYDGDVDDVAKNAIHKKTKGTMVTPSGAFHLAVALLIGMDRNVDQSEAFAQKATADVRGEVVRRWGQKGLVDVVATIFAFVGDVISHDRFQLEALTWTVYYDCVIPAGARGNLDTAGARQALSLYKTLWEHLGEPDIEPLIHTNVREIGGETDVNDLEFLRIVAHLYNISRSEAGKRSEAAKEDDGDEEYLDRVTRDMFAMWHRVSRADSAPSAGASDVPMRISSPAYEPTSPVYSSPSPAYRPPPTPPRHESPQREALSAAKLLEHLIPGFEDGMGFTLEDFDIDAAFDWLVERHPNNAYTSFGALSLACALITQSLDKDEDKDEAAGRDVDSPTASELVDRVERYNQAAGHGPGHIRVIADELLRYIAGKLLSYTELVTKRIFLDVAVPFARRGVLYRTPYDREGPEVYTAFWKQLGGDSIVPILGEEISEGMGDEGFEGIRGIAEKVLGASEEALDALGKKADKDGGRALTDKILREAREIWNEFTNNVSPIVHQAAPAGRPSFPPGLGILAECIPGFEDEIIEDEEIDRDAIDNAFSRARQERDLLSRPGAFLLAAELLDPMLNKGLNMNADKVAAALSGYARHHIHREATLEEDAEVLKRIFRFLAHTIPQKVDIALRILTECIVPARAGGRLDATREARVIMGVYRRFWKDMGRPKIGGALWEHVNVIDAGGTFSDIDELVVATLGIPENEVDEMDGWDTTTKYGAIKAIRARAKRLFNEIMDASEFAEDVSPSPPGEVDRFYIPATEILERCIPMFTRNTLITGVLTGVDIHGAFDRARRDVGPAKLISTSGVTRIACELIETLFDKNRNVVRSIPASDLEQCLRNNALFAGRPIETIARSLFGYLAPFVGDKNAAMLCILEKCVVPADKNDLLVYPGDERPTPYDALRGAVVLHHFWRAMGSPDIRGAVEKYVDAALREGDFYELKDLIVAALEMEEYKVDKMEDTPETRRRIVDAAVRLWENTIGSPSSAMPPPPSRVERPRTTLLEADFLNRFLPWAASNAARSRLSAGDIDEAFGHVRRRYPGGVNPPHAALRLACHFAATMVYKQSGDMPDVQELVTNIERFIVVTQLADFETSVSVGGTADGLLRYLAGFVDAPDHAAMLVLLYAAVPFHELGRSRMQTDLEGRRIYVDSFWEEMGRPDPVAALRRELDRRADEEGFAGIRDIVRDVTGETSARLDLMADAVDSSQAELERLKDRTAGKAETAWNDFIRK